MNPGSAAAELHGADEQEKVERAKASVPLQTEAESRGEGGRAALKHTASHREETHEEQMCNLQPPNQIKQREV